MEPDNNKSFKFPAEPASVHDVFHAEVEAVEAERTENTANMSCRNQAPTGYGRNVRTIHDYRHPGRDCLPNPNHFNPFNNRGDKAVLCHRICMITILVIKTFSSVWDITKINWIRNLPEVILSTILAVFGSLFVA